jgi:hypothetical protein
MHNELRYQEKTQTISKSYIKKKKNSASSPHFFVVVENNKIEKQQGHAYGK